MSHTYLLSWDQTGLESCINISDIDKEEMWNALKAKADDESTAGRNNTISSIVNMMQLRARFNSHRHYEIYTIDTVDDISADELRAMFESDPQGSADLVRLRGRKLYSDRQLTHTMKIR